MKILIDDKIEELILVPHISRNVQKKISDIELSFDLKKEKLQKENKDIVAFIDLNSESGINVKKFLEAKSKNKDIEKRVVEFGNKIKDLEYELLYKKVIYATNQNYLKRELKHYFVDFDNLTDNIESPNYSKLSKEEILEFWDNQSVEELSNYLETFRKFL